MGKDKRNFKYYFIFENGDKATFEIVLDAESLKLISSDKIRTAEWTRLDFHQCKNCPLNSNDYPDCPLAVNLSNVLPRFNNMNSFEKVHMIVETNERTYSKKTSLQSGLSSMLGIYMVTSDCPIMAPLRPMVRFHLPFASIEETVFRSVSTYLLKQYFKKKNNQQADWTLKGLMDSYTEIQQLNHGMVERMRAIVEKDANLNALVILDVFAHELPFSISQKMDDLQYLFETSPKPKNN